MKKRRYIRAYTGMILTGGLISFVLTDGFVVSRENLILFDPKGLFFVILFTLIYSFIKVDRLVLNRLVMVHSMVAFWGVSLVSCSLLIFRSRSNLLVGNMRYCHCVMAFWSKSSQMRLQKPKSPINS